VLTSRASLVEPAIDRWIKKFQAKASTRESGCGCRENSPRQLMPAESVSTNAVTKPSRTATAQTGHEKPQCATSTVHDGDRYQHPGKTESMKFSARNPILIDVPARLSSPSRPRNVSQEDLRVIQRRFLGNRMRGLATCSNASRHRQTSPVPEPSPKPRSWRRRIDIGMRLKSGRSPVPIRCRLGGSPCRPSTPAAR